MKSLLPVLLSAAHIARENETLPLTAIRATYLRKCARYGFLPLIVSPDFSAEAIEELYQMAWGVLLIGGSDVDPRHYGAEPHPETRAAEKARDALDIELYKRAAADKKPLLGICRGVQLMCVAAKGELVQHLPDLTDEHHAQKYEEQLNNPCHEILIEAGSLLHQILQADRGPVTSAHHQAIKAPPPGFKISARSPAGIIEAIELIDPEHFCLGVQPHPETEDQGFLEPVFQAFREAMQQYNARALAG